MSIHRDAKIRLTAFWIGAVFGVMLAGNAAAFLMDKSIRDFIFDYQALIGAMLALLAAFVALKATHDQIRDDNKRKLRSARTVLPLALSELCQYSKQCVETMHELKQKYTDESRKILKIPQNVMTMIALPQNAMVVLRDCAEHSDDNIAVQIGSLSAFAQIQYSRFRAIGDDGEDPIVILLHSFNSHIIDATELYSRAAALFEFAREINYPGEGRPFKPIREDMFSSLNNMGLYDHHELDELINQRYS